MTDVLLAVVLLVLIATLAVAIRTLQGTRRSEALGEGRYELLRDQYEERQMLREELQQESQQRKQFMEFLDKTHPQLIEELERERQGYAESTRRAERRTERLEQEHAERLRAQQ
jgi:hypothetical protein